MSASSSSTDSEQPSRRPSRNSSGAVIAPPVAAAASTSTAPPVAPVTVPPAPTASTSTPPAPTTPKSDVRRPQSGLPLQLNDEWVSLNVGGQIFTTTRRTLTLYPGSMLARMFAQDMDVSWRSAKDAEGRYLLDREPAYFAPLLNFLRTGRLVIDPNISHQGVLDEAEFFQLEPVIEQLKLELEEDKRDECYQFLLVSTMTLYYSGLAKTTVRVDGPMSSRRRKEMERMTLVDVFNVVGAWGWTLVSGSGKGGDQEKFIFQRKVTETNANLGSPLGSPEHSDHSDGEEGVPAGEYIARHGAN